MTKSSNSEFCALRRETNDDAEFDGFAFHFPNALIPRADPYEESRLDRHGASGGGVSLADTSTSLSTPDSTLNVA
jgi:hypothetical protein